MEFALMGLRISCTRQMAHRAGSTEMSAPVHRQQSIDVYLDPNDWMGRVQWPDGSKLDVWEALRYRKVLLAIMEWHQKGMFNICKLDEICEIFHINLSAVAKRAYGKLMIVHCVHYNTLPFEIVEQIPELINTVLGVQEAEYAKETTPAEPTTRTAGTQLKERHEY